MLSRLLTSSARSVSYRKLVKCPVKGGEKLTTNVLGIFIKQNYRKVAKGNNPMKNLANLRKIFSELSPAQLSKYQSVANANRKKVAARRAVLKNARTTGYMIFNKKNYASISQNAKGTGSAKCVATIKLLAKAWNRLSSGSKAKYNAEAAKIKKAAISQRDKMIKAYSA